MKKSVLKSRWLISYGLLVLSIVFLLNVSSCRSTDAEDLTTASGPALINVRLESTSFEDGGTVGDASASANMLKATSGFQRTKTQHSRTSFNKDFDLVAELIPVSADSSTSIAGVRNLSAVEQGELGSKIRYKLVVFTQNGSYVTERDYIYGEESSAPILELNGGSTYTFIVYSLNKTTTNAEVSFSAPNNKTLATASVRDMTGNSDDFMYFRKDMVVSGNGPNYLGIVLKHMFSQVTTTINGFDVGYDITALAGHFLPNYSRATANLSDGTITRSGGQVINPISFITTGNKRLTRSNPTQINSQEQGSGSLVLSSLTIGPISKNGATFSGLSFTPGVKYNLNIKLEPSDNFLTHEDQPAVKIAGKIWMRHNLGVNTSLDPDRLSGSSRPQDLHGNYYQFGRNVIVASGTSNYVNSNYNATSNPPANAWNSGTVANPIKTANDPCPSGYRVPTAAEFQNLLNATIPSNTGNLSINSYSTGKILTSKNNGFVQMTLPSQGWIQHLTNEILGRGQLGHFWTSNSTTANVTTYLRFDVTMAPSYVVVFVAGNWTPLRRYAYSIRCTAI